MINARNNFFRIALAFLMIALIAVQCGENGNQGNFNDYFDDGQYKKAAEWLSLNQDGQVDNLKLLRLAQIFSERTDFETAIPLLRRLLKSDPESAPGRLLLANNLRNSEEYNEALGLYDEVAEIDSLRFIVLPERARLFIMLSEFDKAREDVEEARSLQPKYFAVYLADGLLHHAKGDAEVALDLFEVAEQLDPGVSAEASLYAGYILLSSKINLDAMQKFSDAIERGKNINKGYAFINRGVCQFNLFDTAFACQDWDSARLYLPEQADTYLKKYCSDFKGEKPQQWQKN